MGVRVAVLVGKVLLKEAPVRRRSGPKREGHGVRYDRYPRFAAAVGVVAVCSRDALEVPHIAGTNRTPRFRLLRRARDVQGKEKPQAEAAANEGGDHNPKLPAAYGCYLSCSSPRRCCRRCCCRDIFAMIPAAVGFAVSMALQHRGEKRCPVG